MLERRSSFRRKSLLAAPNLSGGGTEAFVMQYSICPPPDRFWWWEYFTNKTNFNRVVLGSRTRPSMTGDPQPNTIEAVVRIDFTAVRHAHILLLIAPRAAALHRIIVRRQ